MGKEEIIIFGTSPYINVIAGKIPYLLKNYETIGLNVFPAEYIGVKHWFFYDNPMLQFCKKNYHGEIIHTRYDLEPDFTDNYEPFFPAYKIFPPEEKTFLYFVNFTITIAIDWCIKNGFEKIYLAGVDMCDINWQHFYNQNGFRKETKGLKKTALAIKELAEHIEIYQLNPEPNEILDLPKFDIMKLIKE